jgi:hypothetical protein
LLVADHPLAILKQDLHLRGRCEEIALEPLPETAVAAYCAARFATTEEAPASFLAALPRLRRWQRRSGRKRRRSREVLDADQPSAVMAAIMMAAQSTQNPGSRPSLPGMAPRL